MKNSTTQHPPVKGFEPIGRCVRKLTLPVRDGLILPGDLGVSTYRPFSTGAHVRVDVQDGYWMHACDARTIGTALGHCASIQIEGTWDGWDNHIGQFGELHGLEVITDKILGAARLQSARDQQTEEWA